MILGNLSFEYDVEESDGFLIKIETEKNCFPQRIFANAYYKGCDVSLAHHETPKMILYENSDNDYSLFIHHEVCGEKVESFNGVTHVEVNARLKIIIQDLVRLVSKNARSNLVYLREN